MVKHLLGHIDEFPEGGMRMIEVDERPYLVVRSEGELCAIDGRCSHMGMDLSKGRLEGHTVECRLHHAVFDLRTGAVLRNLAAKDLRTYPVTVDDGRVYLEL